MRVHSVGNQRPLCLILLQLLQNAKKHGDGKARICIYRRAKSKTYRIKVQDYGKGVTKALADHINSSDWPQKRGEMGIGLTCAKLLAAGQGWRLRVERISKPTTFIVEIPKKPQFSIYEN
jgi:signal transduction histidine kinase